MNGPWDPEQGLRCNPNKLLLDPYAKATTGDIDWNQSLFGYTFGDEDSRNDDDSGPHMTKGVVINPFFDWEGDRRLDVPYNESVIYEAHVKGMTQLHEGVPAEQRGTYAGLAHPSVIDHLKRLGHHRDRADAGAPVHPGQHPARQGAAQLLGLQHPRPSSPPTPTTPPVPAGPRRASRASRCRSSRRW